MMLYVSEEEETEGGDKGSEEDEAETENNDFEQLSFW